jgi:hypothetical protein
MTKWYATIIKKVWILVIGIYLIIGAWDLDITSILSIRNHNKVTVSYRASGDQLEFWPTFCDLKF